VNAVASDRHRRQPGSVEAALADLARRVGGKPDLVVSGATGVRGITGEERDALAGIAAEARVVASGDIVGHTMEAQAPFGVALAAAAIARGQAGDALVTSVGHWRGEGAIRVAAAS
jgi:3-oxoacyl-[acyl-carrier-protein] synthase II